MKTRRALLAFGPIVILLASCAEAPKQSAKEPEKPAEPVGAQFAFHQAFLTARSWAPDLQVLRVRDVPVASVKPDGGKRGAWEITVVSLAKGRSRTYTYSVVEEGNLHKGVFAGLEEPYRGPQGQASPWPVQAFKIDSTAAYETAVKQSADFVKKNPNMPVTFLLEQTSRHPVLTWRVIWGTSVANSSHSVFIGATTGQFLEKAR